MSQDGLWEEFEKVMGLQRISEQDRRNLLDAVKKGLTIDDDEEALRDMLRRARAIVGVFDEMIPIPDNLKSKH